MFRSGLRFAELISHGHQFDPCHYKGTLSSLFTRNFWSHDCLRIQWWEKYAKWGNWCLAILWDGVPNPLAFSHSLSTTTVRFGSVLQPVCLSVCLTDDKPLSAECGIHTQLTSPSLLAVVWPMQLTCPVILVVLMQLTSPMKMVVACPCSWHAHQYWLWHGPCSWHAHQYWLWHAHAADMPISIGCGMAHAAGMPISIGCGMPMQLTCPTVLVVACPCSWHAHQYWLWHTHAAGMPISIGCGMPRQLTCPSVLAVAWPMQLTWPSVLAVACPCSWHGHQYWLWHAHAADKPVDMDAFMSKQPTSPIILILNVQAADKPINIDSGMSKQPTSPIILILNVQAADKPINIDSESPSSREAH